MASKRYPPEIIANCKKLYVYDNWSFRKISDFYDGSPHWQTVQNWAEEEHPETEKTWEEERQEYIDSIVHQITPDKIKQLYMQKIYETLTDPDFNTGHSDSLRKLQKDFREMTDPGNQIPVVYAMLTEFVNYLKQYHNDLITEELLNAIRDYKNYQRNKLQN